MSTELDVYYNSIVDLTLPDVSYNLQQAHAMKCALQRLEAMEADIKKAKTAIANNFARTIGEYREAGIEESDGIKIIVAKVGRATLNEVAAREKFPDVCNEAQVEYEIFDVERFKKERPEEYQKYVNKGYNITLTAIRNTKKLTGEEEESIITRAESTYDVVAESGKE